MLGPEQTHGLLQFCGTCLSIGWCVACNEPSVYTFDHSPKGDQAYKAVVRKHLQHLLDALLHVLQASVLILVAGVLILVAGCALQYK